MPALRSQGTTFGIGDDGLTYTTVGQVVGIQGPSGQAQEIDTTHLSSTAIEILMGLPDNGTINLSINVDPTDTGQSTMITARNAQAVKHFQITRSNGSTRSFQGFVLSADENYAPNGKVEGSYTVRITGPIADAAAP